MEEREPELEAGAAAVFVRCGAGTAMFDTGRVVTGGQFASWIAQQQTRFREVTKELPPYSTTYNPDPTDRAG